MHDFGTIVTVDVKGGTDASSRFSEALELFSIAASLGSTESLVVPPTLERSKGFTAEQKVWSDVGPGTVRLSIGLEDAGDLIDDLDKALGAANHD
jgi:cystathionine beta-lyase/cystathionine gamma-synthase